MLKFEAKKEDFPQIWQKLGAAAPLPPPPPSSAAHDELKNAFYTSTNKFYSHLNLMKNFLDFWQK